MTPLETLATPCPVEACKAKELVPRSRIAPTLDLNLHWLRFLHFNSQTLPFMVLLKSFKKFN